MTNEHAHSRRWIMLALIALGIAILIAVVAMMISGGGHSPARHFSTTGAWTWSR